MIFLKNKISLCVAMSLCFIVVLSAQDKHFSQFYHSPLQLNPALSGVMNGTYRVNLNYRNQWNSLEGGNYSTVGFSGDMNFTAPFRFMKNDKIGIGVSFFSDKANEFGLQTNELAFVGAYHKTVGKNQFLSLGLKTGIYQSGINFENLRFEDQYVEGSGYSKNTNERLPENSVNFPEIALGINYNWSGKENKSFNIGTSLHHITSPDFSFFNLSLPTNTEPILQPLYSLMTAHVSGSWQLANKSVISPRVWVLSQGQDFMATVGTSYSIPIDQDYINKLELGAYLRGVKNIQGFGPESIIPVIGLDLGNLHIGLSYDANARRFAPSYLNQSIFELAISFTGSSESITNICPKF